MNNIALSGNLVADPEETREVAEGQRVRSFRLATSRGEREPLYIDCECWNGVTQFLDAAAKGDPVVVTGELLVDRWKNQDGKNRERLFIRAREVKLLRKKEPEASAE